MQIFEIVIALLLGGAILTALARRMGVPYPALVAVAGAALALLPGTPTLLLDPELALALFVAPVLLDAAFDASPRDLARNWRPIAGLSIGAVAFTIAAVAVVVHSLAPGMTWAVAIALGAIVAPPDAAAAMAVLKQVRPPHRLLVILEGESLFNDVSALLVYRLAVAAAVTGSAGQTTGWGALGTVLVVTGGSIVLGFVSSRITVWWGSRIRDLSSSVIMQFSSTFAVWLVAERLHLSGILTTVVYAMATSRQASDVIPARIRIPSYAVWEVVVFILNVLAFVLVGLQLRPIVSSLDAARFREYLLIAGAVCAAAVLARLVWVMGVGGVSSWWCQRRARQGPEETDLVALTPGASAVVGWCGMRGIVTLATALALPGTGNGHGTFPYRDLILFTAFAVVLGTLVIQGVTLRPLMAALRLSDDGLVDREVQLARLAILEAALTVTREAKCTEVVELMHHRYQWQWHRAKQEAETAAGSPDELWLSLPEDAEVVRQALEAERGRLLALRADGTIGDAAFQRVEVELDWRELDLEQFLKPGHSDL